jgi:hypothetical protein
LRSWLGTLVAILAPIAVFFLLPPLWESTTPTDLPEFGLRRSEQPVQAARVELRTVEQQEIVAYVREVFGPDTDRALRLLACENAQLNPRAVNAIGNTPAGSRDLGLFQINEYWQQTEARFLLNWKLNVLLAKQLFDESGGSFRLWSCGQRLGI